MHLHCDIYIYMYVYIYIYLQMYKRMQLRDCLSTCVLMRLYSLDSKTECRAIGITFWLNQEDLPIR